MIKPLEIVKNYFEEAQKLDLKYPNYAVLSTSRNNIPDARYVLIKEIRDNGLIFYTNYDSKKGKDLEINPRACIVFYWQELGIQIRIRGNANKISEKESDDYFRKRPRESQISAWASKQSQELENYEKLMEKFQFYKKIFENKEIPRPAYWGGYLITPEEIEIWEEKPSRLHKRTLYYLENGIWKWKHLYP